MILLLYSFLSGCSYKDPGVSWVQHEPTFDSEPPTGDLTWAIEGEAPGGFDSKLAQALEEWQVSMACRFQPRRISDPKQAMVTFLCAEPPYHPADHGKIATFQVVESKDRQIGAIMVYVKPEFCDSAGDIFMMHATGHAIGLADETKWYENTMSQTSIMPEYWSDEIPRMERDGFRIWALRHGAPGCGERDPQWSWIERPDDYPGGTPDLDKLFDR